MSKAALDSDLYGDIYGDDDNDFGFTDPAVPEGDAPETLKQEEPSSQHSQQSSSSSSKADLPSSLPAKPTADSSQSAAPSLSYSAQIAQQFSAYQQTPSQERQQRHPSSQSRVQVSLKTSPIATVDSSATDSDTVFGKKPSEMHDAGKLFIGGLNWDTTDEGLRDYFSQFGKVDACTIMRDPSGTSRGFAFLTFEDPNAVSAVTSREHILDGKAIDPKRAIPREEHLRNTRYFVGGLAPSTSSETMKSFFAAYGKVVDATVMLDRESGRSKGFGFVTFEDAANTDQLVGKNLVLDDKQIEVKMAQPRSQRDQARNSISNNASNSLSTNRDSFDTTLQQATIPFMPQQQNPMSMMLQQRPMGQMPMIGTGMPMINMNPMAMMGMGMNNFNPMSAGVNMMGGGMNGMSMMNGMNVMGNAGAMRLGMGPMGANTGMGGSGMNNVGMVMRPGVNNMTAGMMGPIYGRMAGNAGPGPLRLNNRGQHNFHPYAR